MRKIHARKLLTYSEEQLWTMLTGNFTLIMDDGEVETNARETLFSLYIWALHREFNETPLLIKHHLRSVLGSKRLSDGASLELLGRVYWSVFYTYCKDKTQFNPPIEDIKLRDYLSYRITQISSAMYCDMIKRCEAFVTSLDAMDMLQIVDHPDIQAAMDELKPTQESVRDTYLKLGKVLMTHPDLTNNSISLALQSSLIKKGQVLQSVGFRGYLTDIDDHQFPIPVMRGYGEGFRSFYDGFIESRSSAKSLTMSKAQLEQTEYFSRRLQLICSIVERLHFTDCGSTKYLPWLVRGETMEGGRMTAAGDLDQLAGMYYVDETTNTLKAFSKKDRHLIGKTLNFRNPIHCAHPDPNGICSTCFGELSLSVPEHTNIGHACCVTLTAQSSQSVLSVKHLDLSAAIEAILLSNVSKQYLRVGDDGSSYCLAKALEGKQVELVIHPDNFKGVTDILDVENLDELSLANVCQMNVIGMVITDTFDGTNMRDEPMLNVNVGRRMASFTYPMLHYVRQNRYTVDRNGNYVIKMDDWDIDEPFLTLPPLHINMSDHSADIAAILESNMKSKEDRDTASAPGSVLFDLYTKVNERLSVNLAVLSVVLHAVSVRSTKDLDYALPKPYTKAGLGVRTEIFSYRSIAPALAFEKHHEIYNNPLSYTLTNRPDHPLDFVVCPELCNPD